jgi:hypothetical protein
MMAEAKTVYVALSTIIADNSDADGLGRPEEERT